MRLLAYFLLTFLVTWSVWFAASSLAAPGNTGLFGARPCVSAGCFAPALVALAFTAHAEGSAGVTRLLARIGHWLGGAVGTLSPSATSPPLSSQPPSSIAS